MQSATCRSFFRWEIGWIRTWFQHIVIQLVYFKAMLSKTNLAHTRHSISCTITKLWLILFPSHDLLLNRKSSCRWFERSWRSCGVNVSTMLQRPVSVLQMTTSPVRERIWFLCYKTGHAVEKQSNDRWFGTPWRSCCVTLMTMLQNAILVLQMIKYSMRECGGFLFY